MRSHEQQVFFFFARDNISFTENTLLGNKIMF